MLKPLGDDLLVRRLRKRKMGIFNQILIPYTQETRIGKVIAVGESVRILQEGDIVHLPAYKDREVYVGNLQLELHPYQEIIAKYESIPKD